ncbi:unnamed protein product [Amoebophrya sp. A25]|nr:unnamed protein product [Amoebophrya sp. A25]|eukprot:GSA25T00005419001.1
MYMVKPFVTGTALAGGSLLSLRVFAPRLFDSALRILGNDRYQSITGLYDADYAGTDVAEGLAHRPQEITDQYYSIICFLKYGRTLFFRGDSNTYNESKYLIM